jgi:hypothetical protein
MRIPIALSAALALAATGASAATVDVTSTTLLRVGQETRGGLPSQSPELETVAPAFEILSISARGVSNPVAQDLAIVLNTWGSYEIAERRWDNGTSSNLTGDVVTGYIQGRLADRRITLRVGRAHVMTGAARMIHLDGGEAIAAIPGGLRLSAYAGVPVAQRFTTRQTVLNWNPVGGNVAYGGRLAWTYGRAGYPGRGVELGVSANIVENSGDPVREEAAADLRLQPFRDLTLSGFGAFSLYDERVSEVAGRLAWSAGRNLRLALDGRYVEPGLLLTRNSILSVFSASEQKSFGGGLEYEVRNLTTRVAYHLQLEPPELAGGSDEIGHEADLALEWQRGQTLAGLELSYLDALQNGFFGVRAFGRRELGRFFAAADVLSHFFREAVNGEDLALTGTLTAGVNIARGFSAVVSGRAGMTPFLEQTFDVMAKLAYNQTYRLREVR